MLSVADDPKFCQDRFFSQQNLTLVIRLFSIRTSYLTAITSSYAQLQ